MSVRLHDIHKAFGNKDVLTGFSIEVHEGETVSIIGASGAGKSVALKHIVGLIRPDRGEVWVDGENVGRLSQEELFALRRDVGYVFQFAALFDSMTIGENVGMGLRRIPDMSSRAIADRVGECLSLVDLEGFESRYPAEISGGQRKRVGLARAIATKPKYLLYDEPTTGLDPVTTAVIGALIARMRKELGVTGIVITHDMGSAFQISDRIAMLYDGSVRMEGTPEEVRSTDDPVVRGFVEGRPDLLEDVS
ncbi:MAG: ABC transporter ATP-binding protein [Gemmatimonadota bacterium]|jgi:phospholipid/cholesterol/gamma-HCH transport system ATP-binding protein